MGRKKFLRKYIGQQLFMLCDDDMDFAMEHLDMSYDTLKKILETLNGNRMMSKAGMKHYRKLLEQTPLWQEAEEAYAAVMCPMKESYSFVPDPICVEEAWGVMDGLTDGQLIKVASEVKKQKREKTKEEIKKVREIVVPLLKIYAEKEEVNMDVSDCPDQVSFTVVLRGQNGFACDMSDFLARTVFSLASYIDACRETDNSMRLELTYAP